jgi:hypothetical protein
MITKEDEVSKFDNFNDCPFVGLSNDDPLEVINSFKFNELYDKKLNRCFNDIVHVKCSDYFSLALSQSGDVQGVK